MPFRMGTYVETENHSNTYFQTPEKTTVQIIVKFHKHVVNWSGVYRK